MMAISKTASKLAFSWRPYGKGQSKVFEKTLGVFSEREIRAEMLKLEEGATLKVGGDDAHHLFFVVKGSGTSEGGEALKIESSIHLKPRTSTEGSCSGEALELLHYALPLLDAESIPFSYSRCHDVRRNMTSGT